VAVLELDVDDGTDYLDDSALVCSLDFSHCYLLRTPNPEPRTSNR
jgi:hypothetical protein